MRYCFCPALLIPLLISTATSLPSEDWSNPRVDRQALMPQPPMLGKHDDLEQFTADLVRVQWRAKDPIYLHVMVPKSSPKPPVILYLYNYDSDTDRFLDLDLGKVLIARGVAAVGFISALSGQRYHDRPMTQWFVSELPESLGSTSHDVQMIIDYLATRGDIDTSRVGMFGVGSGASISVLAASADSRIKALALINPWGDWPEWLQRSTIVPQTERASLDNKVFLNKAEVLDPIRFLPRLKIPVRLEYVNWQGAIPPNVKQNMVAAASPSTLVVPPDQSAVDFRQASGQFSLDWIKDKVLSCASSAKPH